MNKAFILTIAFLILTTGSVLASGEVDSTEAGHGHFAITFFWIAVILLIAKTSSVVEKLGQPAVLGELLAGVILGNLALIGIYTFEPIKSDEVIMFLAELGVVVLLFQIGLESSISEMLKVGGRAGMVAVIGVAVPFALGALVGPILLPGLDTNAYLFLGATLAATSVGITARVFKDLGRIQSKGARIVLGAAVIDDVLGLIILAVITAIVTTGTISGAEIAIITGKAAVFLVVSVALGRRLAPTISRFFAKLHAGAAMKFTIVISFALIYAYMAQLIGLAPIVGAFAAGLLLEHVHFRHFNDPAVVEDAEEIITDLAPQIKEVFMARLRSHSDKHIEDLIAPLGNFLVPIFFVYTGLNVNLEVLTDPAVLTTALAITAIAIVGKIVAGIAAPKDANRLIVGVGMVPRGEVGLIFAAIGYGLGVVSDQIYSIIVVMVILTTLITPPVLAFFVKRDKSALAE